MGGCQSKSSRDEMTMEHSTAEGTTETTTTANNTRRRPPDDCDGYPLAFLPHLDDRSCCDAINFYLPSDHRCGVESCETCDRNKRGTSEREIACTLVRHRPPPSESPSHDGDDGKQQTDDCSIEDVTAAATMDLDQTKPVVVVCHGLLSWRNQMLLSHLSARLSSALGCHALRFDFGGNGHSSGSWRYGNYLGELCDLRCVVNYVRNTLKCRVACIVGHSKGTAAVLRYAWENERSGGHRVEEGDGVGDGGGGVGGENGGGAAAQSLCVVNLAGRFTVPNDFDPTSRFTQRQLDELATHGKFILFTRGDRSYEVTQHDLNERRTHDMSFVEELASTPVLTIHGDADKDVVVKNARRFDEVIPRHEMHIVEGADHNFNGLKHMDELVTMIASFVRSNHSK